MLAASSRSRGIPSINCMIMKINRGFAHQAGTMIGDGVLTQPNMLKMMYWGIMITWFGSIMVIIMQRNSTRFPLKFARANP